MLRSCNVRTPIRSQRSPIQSPVDVRVSQIIYPEVKVAPRNQSEYSVSGMDGELASRKDGTTLYSLSLEPFSKQGIKPPWWEQRGEVEVNFIQRDFCQGCSMR